MIVRAIVNIASRRGLIKAGTTFTVTPDALPKLTGKVEPVQPIPTMTSTETAERIGAVAAELDKARPWPGDVCNLLSQESRDRIKAADRAVDYAADELRDPEALDAALKQYKLAWMFALQIAKRSQT